MWGSSSQLHNQKPHAPPNEPARYATVTLIFKSIYSDTIPRPGNYSADLL